VIAAGSWSCERALAVDGCGELAAPDDEGVVERPRDLDLSRGRGGLVNVFALFFEMVGEVAVLVHPRWKSWMSGTPRSLRRRRQAVAGVLVALPFRRGRTWRG